MTDFLNTKPSSTYKSLLNVGNQANTTIDTTLRTIEDGRGNETALSLSSTTVLARRLVVDDITIDGSTISGAVIEEIDGGEY
tara:strand:- start:1971 stop:2216 length:246 start_codon:yes stop_codon:yes gene_type:complete